jgi:hypothetical protein
MLAHHEVRSCLMRYARGLDRHDAALAKSAYHADARDDHVLYVGSGHGLVEWANRQHAATVHTHQHYIMNVSIELDGDQAHVESYWMFAGTLAGHANTLGGGRYVDRFERREGRWGIAARQLIVEWWQDPAEIEMLQRLGVPSAQGPADPSYRRPLTVDRADREPPVPGA